MTTIVTRLYENAAHAADVVAKLKAEGFPDNCMDVVAQKEGSSAQDAILDAGVPTDIAQQYAQHMTSSRALLVVRAPFVPFGAAKAAIEAADEHPAFDAGVVDQNLNVRDEVNDDLFTSIFPSHRKFLTGDYELRNDMKPRGFSANFRIPTLAERGKKMRASVIHGGKVFFGVSNRHDRMSKRLILNKFFARFAMPHIWHRTPNRQSWHFRLTN